MAITYQSSHPQYYKYLSDYQLSAECNLSSDGEIELIRIKSIMMMYSYCQDHTWGFTPPKDAVVKTVKYPGFSVIALGVPRNIWLPDLTSFELMRRDLRANGHLLTCWDNQSVALITDKVPWVAVCEEFLIKQKFQRFIDGAGLILSLEG